MSRRWLRDGFARPVGSRLTSTEPLRLRRSDDRLPPVCPPLADLSTPGSGRPPRSAVCAHPATARRPATRSVTCPPGAITRARVRASGTRHRAASLAPGHRGAARLVCPRPALGRCGSPAFPARSASRACRGDPRRPSVGLALPVDMHRAAPLRRSDDRLAPVCPPLADHSRPGTGASASGSAVSRGARARRRIDAGDNSTLACSASVTGHPRVPRLRRPLPASDPCMSRTTPPGAVDDVPHPASSTRARRTRSASGRAGRRGRTRSAGPARCAWLTPRDRTGGASDPCPAGRPSRLDRGLTPRSRGRYAGASASGSQRPSAPTLPVTGFAAAGSWPRE